MDYIERETGQFPVSIGTSLALEGLFGMHPQEPKQPPGHQRINRVWINLQTIIRNFYQAMTSKARREVVIELAVEQILEEMEQLQVVIAQRGRHELVIYAASMDEVRWQYPHATYREPKTERQRFEAQQEQLTLELLLPKQGRYADTYQTLQGNNVRVLGIKSKPAAQPGVVALLTHHPHELLWRFQFDGLFLLESHTGRLKSTGQWKSKLNGLKDEDMLPFNAFTLQVFGEKTLFAGSEKKIRDEVRQMAEARNWNNVTTIEKIRDDIGRFGSEVLRRTYGQLMGR